MNLDLFYYSNIFTIKESAFSLHRNKDSSSKHTLSNI